MKVNLNKIRGLMAENRDSQKDLAKKLGVTRQTVNNYLTSRIELSVSDVNEIAKIYGVDAFILIMPEN